MPCTLEPWEIAVEERRSNRKQYGVDLTDEGLMTRLLCQAVKLIPAGVLRRKGSAALQAWAKGHAKQDVKKKRRK